MTMNETKTKLALDDFTRGYIEAMLWSSTCAPFGECAECGADAVLCWHPETGEYETCRACTLSSVQVAGDESKLDNPPGDPSADENYGPKDLAPETLARIVADCERFQSENRLSLGVYEPARETGEWTGAELAGHDFWLTRTGHGTGFWDRFYARSTALVDLDRDKPEERKQAILARVGDKLSARCRWRTAYPELNLYVGDDGRLYLT